MRSSHVTQGATMIVVVLFTLLLLAGILAATVRLGLGSRQNSADQVATLRAQYAAESGVALVQSRLRDIEAMLSTPTSAAPEVGLKLSPVAKPSTVRSWVNALCGSGTWADIYEGQDRARGFYDKTPAVGDEEKSYPNAQACVPDAPNSSDNFVLLAKVVTPGAYGLLPASERPAEDETARKVFWQNVFTRPSTLNINPLATTTTTNLSIARVLRLTPTHHRVFVQVRQVTISGTAGIGGVRRVLAAQGAQTGQWWFDIEQPSLLDAVVQTDYQTAANGSVVNFTTNTRFQGPLKTNDVFAFSSTGGYNSPSFSGQLTSAGCIDRITSADNVSCTRLPGVRINASSTVSTNRNFTGTDAEKSTAIQNHIRDQGVNVNYNGSTPNFAGQYQPFPTNAQNQANAANGLDSDGQPLINERGLALSSAEVGVQMFVGDGNMAPVSTYDATNRRWQEPNPAYQYIRPITNQNCTNTVGGCTYTYSNTIYRVDRDGNVEQKTGLGSWVAAPGKFNGVIYKSGNNALTVVGPDPGRVAGADPTAQALPALASFSGITVATAGQLDIRSDLALSQSPCRYDEYNILQVQPPCKERENVLGLFSSTGNVVVKPQVPNNAVIQAALMSSQQEFTVEGYNSGPPRGDMILTGSLVEKYYGANGTFGTERYCSARDRYGNCTQYSNRPVETGYTRDYSYDRRFSEGITPPYYPTSPTWEFVDAATRGQNLPDLIWKQATP